MIRKIIQIDSEKCNGCGLCAKACHENAIAMINGKAVLLRDDYCDGLGDCLPACPTGAITFVEKEAAAYNEAAVKAHMKQKEEEQKPIPCGCPGMMAKAFEHTKQETTTEVRQSQLNQWPVQIKLINPNAAYLDGADLLIAADCTAYAYGNFHNDFIKDKITLIGCPKLDEGDYSEKLTQILQYNNIKHVTVVRMEVPCCGSIVRAVLSALENCDKTIPCDVVTISTDGKILK